LFVIGFELLSLKIIFKNTTIFHVTGLFLMEEQAHPLNHFYIYLRGFIAERPHISFVIG